MTDRRDLIASAILSRLIFPPDFHGVRRIAANGVSDPQMWGDYLKAAYRIADAMIDEEHKP